MAAHPLASVNGLVMTMRCIQFGAGSNQTVGYVYVNPTGAATINWMLAEIFSASGGSADTVDVNGASLPGGEYEVFRFNNVVGAGAPVRVEGQLVFRTASGQVTTVAIHAFAVAGNGGHCQVTGTATPGA